jgi:HAD superfamily hydrolase (TIGR01457 family)
MRPLVIKALILDIDGVIWKDEEPIGDLESIFSQIKKKGLRFAFATNNGSRTPDQYVERLARVGVYAESWQVITSSLTLSHLLKKRFPNGCSVFAIGERGLLDALSTNGFELLPIEKIGLAQAIAMGIDREINFRKIAEATLRIQQGVPFYATNPDLTFPTPRGEIPGAGAWVSVIVSATNIEPRYAGKPAPDILELACERLEIKKEETLVVGDRLSTDIAGGQSAGMPVALVCSGVSTQKEGEKWKPKINLITDDLGTLIDIL